MSQRPSTTALSTAPRPPPRRTGEAKPEKQRPVTPPPIIVNKREKIEFTLGEFLGQGGFAKCYKVTQGIKVSAAKVVWKPSLKTGKQRQKLLSEIQIHQSLFHPNIVSFQSVFEDDENVYLILELCENKTFVDLIKKRKRLTNEECRFWMWQLLDGIRYMHRKGYIHRDIKLGNLFLDSRMNLKIGDFGLAAQIDHDGERKKVKHISQKQTICGTPNYIAPEILFDTKNGHSFEVDSWSLGVVMYTWLIGKPPFQTKEVKAIYKNIRDNVYEFPESIPILGGAKSIITAFLNPKPEDRPSLDDVMEHDYFIGRPAFIPLNALVEIPIFNKPSATVIPIHAPASNVNWRSPPKITRQTESNAPFPPTLPLRSPFPPRNLEPLNPNLALKLSEVSLKNSPDAQATPTKSSSWVSATENNYSPRMRPTTENQENQSPANTTAKSGIKINRLAHHGRSRSTVVSSPPANQSASRSVGMHTKLSSLDEVYQVLTDGLRRAKSLSQADLHRVKTDASCKSPKITSVPAHPTIFITKWIDYTNKYGLSYQLRDGSVGVYFNDSTSIILASDGDHFEYLYYDRSAERPLMHRREHTLKLPPSDLSKKITLLKHFKGYMQDNLTKAYLDGSNEAGSPIRRLDFLTKYLRTKNGVIFRLSNHSLQVKLETYQKLNLFDHTKLILSQGGQVVTYIGKGREMETKSLEQWIYSNSADVLERLGYCRDIVEQMCSPKV